MIRAVVMTKHQPFRTATVILADIPNCPWTMASLSSQPVFDYVPGSNQRIIVHAGLDGYSFKYGSVYGMEFLELLDTGKPPKDCHWPAKKEKEQRNIFVRLFIMLARNAETGGTRKTKDD